MKISRLVVCLAMGSLALSAGDLKKQGEVNVFGGGVHINDGGGNKGLVGGSLGYGIASKAQIFGEYTLVSLGYDVSAKAFLFTGGVKVNTFSNDRLDVYTLGGFGRARITVSSGSVSVSETYPALHLGGGARLYTGRKWGINPEIRYIRVFADGPELNAISYTGGIFFRWGGQ